MDTVVLNDVPAPARPRLSVQAILAIAVLAVLTVVTTWRARVLEINLERAQSEPALVDKPAPDFSAVTLDGRTVSLADFRGQKKIVVSFWASWCGPCRREMPVLVKFYNDNHNASSDFEILAVSIDEDTKDASVFAAEQRLKFPVLLDPQQKMAGAYQVNAIPVIFVIDENGKITDGHTGFSSILGYELKSELGIKDKKPPEGAADGDVSH